MDKRFAYPLLIVLLGSLAFIPFLGEVHLFDWDEINFAESAREMLVTGDYTTVRINYLPFWEKPPLFIWFQAISMHFFGINEMAARLPNAICGIVTLLIIYSIGCKLYNKRFGLIWVMAYIGSILPFFYFKFGIIDPWFNLFIFLSIYFLIRFQHRQNNAEAWTFIILSATASGLGVMTKGPVAILLLALTAGVYLLIHRFRFPVKWYHITVFILVLSLVGGIWFILLLINGNYSVIKDFISYQIDLFRTQGADHGGFLFYHFIVLYLGVFPASILALLSGQKVSDETALQKDFKLWMVILFWVVLILFTVVNTKIIHYSSMCYFPITYLAAWAVYYISNQEISFKASARYSLVVVSIFYTILAFAVSQIDIIKTYLLQYNLIQDEFVQGNLQAVAGWNGWEWFPAVLLPSGVFACLYYTRNKLYANGFGILFFFTMLFTFFSMMLLLPRIEAYSQRAVIDFYKSLKGKDCYVERAGFKSYANLFYFQKPPVSQFDPHDYDRLSQGSLDKPLYIVMKANDKKDLLSKNPKWNIIYERNGFVFCIRNPEKLNDQ